MIYGILYFSMPASSVSFFYYLNQLLMFFWRQMRQLFANLNGDNINIYLMFYYL